MALTHVLHGVNAAEKSQDLLQQSGLELASTGMPDQRTTCAATQGINITYYVLLSHVNYIYLVSCLVGINFYTIYLNFSLLCQFFLKNCFLAIAKALLFPPK